MIDTELPKAMALARQSERNAHNDAGSFSTAFNALENIKDKVEATYHPDRGRFRPEMYHIRRHLSDLLGFKDIRKSVEVFRSFILSMPTPLVLIAILSE